MRILRLFSGRNLVRVFMVSMITVSLFSCKVERIAILKDIPDTASVRYVSMQNFTPPVVKPDDILNITIQTLDLQANQILNQGNLPILSGAVNSGTQNGQQSAVTGYLISKEGDVHMPYIGDVKVQGLTTDQVRLLITEKIAGFFKDPVVNVRFANFRVSVLGEVKNPSTFL
ncbi:MAG TPA: polysaccharide biosynthesis/export family protein, partial [Chitinophagaceae bacterium]|nr:polysaccharide biosynthesis/export family protein [Chitinophagaceae bacterium]